LTGAIPKTQYTHPSTLMPDRIEERARFDLVRYANVWEDAEILRAALRPSPGRRFLSIASAGDNAFAILASGAEVVAADLSMAQLALVDLKRAAIRRLGYEELLGFLGVLGTPQGQGPRRGDDDRRAVYERLERDLSAQARDFWRERQDVVAAGVVQGGKFEAYFSLFRSWVLPLVHRRQKVLALIAERDEAGRRTFYRETWDNLRWRLLFRVFFSRFVMGRLGRDPESFRYVEGSVAERILERAEYALTVLPVHSNPYIEFILTGRFRQALPFYLQPDVWPDLRRHLDRLTLFAGSIDDAAREHQGDGFDGFNLSDIFEYLDPETSAAVYGRLVDAARPGARLAYWNMLVPRRLAGTQPGRVRPLDAEARELYARDRAFFYNAFVLEEVGIHSRDDPAPPPRDRPGGGRLRPLRESRRPHSTLGVPHGGCPSPGGRRPCRTALPAGQPDGRTALGATLEHPH
jgi:S-adenosylmethionine-diacylglycerol 3-amino-3-carboxypropyl transferase